MNPIKGDTNVPVEIAKDMVSAYASEASKYPKSYTKAVWFPADQILEIAKTLSDGKHDGLRIYFGQYTAESLDGLPKEFEGRNTALLVPTYAAGFKNSLGDPTEEHEDDIDDIGNRGELCPSMCAGAVL
ncbi:hypothetical protein EZ449_01220 [Pedobacter frigidisoli]|uniref:Uncharacterized protein n=1 Tax=Pedobacter frigidisoli TaxID=2530455 RepID=A0A4R0PCE3_9SPHI|nr:hypothetical protein [Pedobacter frigidisoli]TCD12693.1 hypothetical protein EZ449_01220 [Pedobacter frigidisoli]